ncbi:MAG TPA: hypothetical protein VKI19_02995 [Acidimicrobiales bacterium]|nr:hypothetical protein [Acidimicrobiales bacterium]
MTVNVPKRWSTVCELTNGAMDALADVEQSLIAVDSGGLTPLEFRTLMWVRCSLATLYGVRTDETVSEAVAFVDSLGGDWVEALLAE